MATFVICHGASDGGWFWKKPSDDLQKLGHEVYRLTLLPDSDNVNTRYSRYEP